MNTDQYTRDNWPARYRITVRHPDKGAFAFSAGAADDQDAHEFADLWVRHNVPCEVVSVKRLADPAAN